MLFSLNKSCFLENHLYEMDPEMLQEYENFIINMYQHVKNKVVMHDNEEQQIESIIAKFTKSAQKEFKRVNNDIAELQNSETENEYMKSMLAKQKSYIPRFALLVNMLDYLEHEIYKKYKQNPNDYPADLHTVVESSVFKAERLSKYFINMAKKIKMKSSETFELKKMVSALKAKSKKEQVQEIHKANPKFNRSEAADLMGVSRQTINQWIRDIKESK